MPQHVCVAGFAAAVNVTGRFSMTCDLHALHLHHLPTRTHAGTTHPTHLQTHTRTHVHTSGHGAQVHVHKANCCLAHVLGAQHAKRWADLTARRIHRLPYAPIAAVLGKKLRSVLNLCTLSSSQQMAAAARIPGKTERAGAPQCDEQHRRVRDGSADLVRESASPHPRAAGHRSLAGECLPTTG